MVGYTIEQHEAILKSRQSQLRADLTRASTAEKQVIQLQLAAVQQKLFDLETSFAEAEKEITRLKSELASLVDIFPSEDIERAQLALAQGDTDTADNILKEAEARLADAVKASARTAFLRGNIAEGEIRWQDAYDHFKRAYGQDPTLDHLRAYARLCWRMGRWEEAVPLHKDILKQVEAKSGTEGNDYATALNNLAAIYENIGQYSKAEPLYDEALTIRRRVLDADHPDTAGSLNNLAGLYRSQGRYSEAEPLYTDALSIRRRVLGADHPSTAISLHNLAGLYRVQGRYAEAAPLFNEAVEIVVGGGASEHENCA